MAGGVASRGWRLVLPIVATIAIITPLAILWQASLVPKTFSVLDMGYPDYGGVAAPASGHSVHEGPGVSSVDTLVADPRRKADVLVNLVAASATLNLAGHMVPGFTLN